VVSGNQLTAHPQNRHNTCSLNTHLNRDTNFNKRSPITGKPAKTQGFTAESQDGIFGVLGG
jgi:hypothetical protein